MCSILGNTDQQVGHVAETNTKRNTNTKPNTNTNTNIGKYGPAGRACPLLSAASPPLVSVPLLPAQLSLQVTNLPQVAETNTKRNTNMDTRQIQRQVQRQIQIYNLAPAYPYRTTLPKHCTHYVY